MSAGGYRDRSPGGKVECGIAPVAGAKPPSPRPNGTSLGALGRAWRWHRLLEAGAHPPIKALAQAEGVHHAYVGKLLRLTLLAPDVVEAVLDGRLPKGVRLEDLVRPLPVPATWEEQRWIVVRDHCSHLR